MVINITNPDSILNSQGAVTSGGIITIKPTTLEEEELEFSVAQGLNARTVTMKASELGDIEKVSDHWNLTTNLIPSGSTWYIRAVYTTNRVALNQWDLDSLDKMKRYYITNGRKHNMLHYKSRK